MGDRKAFCGVNARIVCLLWCCIVTAPGLAFETIKLPFQRDKDPFQIQVRDQPSLQALLVNELRHQRKSNRQLAVIPDQAGRARLESKLLLERLQAEGYYDAIVRIEKRVDKQTFIVDSGEQYSIQTLRLQLPDHLIVPVSVLGVSTGQPLRAESILSAEDALQAHIRKHFCLFVIDTDYEVIADYSSKTAHVSFRVEDSPEAHIGDVQLSGLRSVNDEYLRSRIPLRAGDCFKRSRIDAAKLVLLQTQLLSRVNVDIGEPANGQVSLIFQVEERHHRTVSAGIGYEADDDFGLTLGWEHRNIAGKAHKLELQSKLTGSQQRLSMDYAIPHFRNKNQTLTAYGEMDREETDAFETDAVELGMKLSRPLGIKLQAAFGTELSFSEISDSLGSENEFALFSLPMSIEYDRRVNLLDPREGFVVFAQFQPYRDLYDSDTDFFKSSIATSLYLSLDHLAWRPTLALRAAAGSIRGSNSDAIPASERFYVGGGGSVRGYPFQSLGPLQDDKPQGGKSFTELSSELRFQWSENWGGVAFLDGGLAFADSTPLLDESLRWGAGLGLRFFSSFAPIRVDVAVPLERRRGIDDRFQLYISIGQAF